MQKHSKEAMWGGRAGGAPQAPRGEGGKQNTVALIRGEMAAIWMVLRSVA